MFPSEITIRVTQANLDKGGWRGIRPDAIHLALWRDYPDFEPRVLDPYGGIGLIDETDTMGWYPATPEFVALINEIDLTDGQPRPTTFTMMLGGTTRPAPARQRTFKTYRALLTQQGAERIGRPDLAGVVVDYTGVTHPLGLVVDNVHYQDKLLAETMGFSGEDKSVELLDKPDEIR